MDQLKIFLIVVFMAALASTNLAHSGGTFLVSVLVGVLFGCLSAMLAGTFFHDCGGGFETAAPMTRDEAKTKKWKKPPVRRQLLDPSTDIFADVNPIHRHITAIPDDVNPYAFSDPHRTDFEELLEQSGH